MFFDSEIDRAFKRMTESIFETDGIFEGAKDRLGPRPQWYGYALSVGPNGVPVFREYAGRPEKAAQDSAREPTVETILDEKNGEVKLIAEIPGVERSDIQILVDDGVADISAKRGSKKYRARVPVRHSIDEKSAKASYKNGILQLVFKRAAEVQTGTKVEVD